MNCNKKGQENSGEGTCTEHDYLTGNMYLYHFNKSNIQPAMDFIASSLLDTESQSPCLELLPLAKFHAQIWQF